MDFNISIQLKYKNVVFWGDRTPTCFRSIRTIKKGKSSGRELIFFYLFSFARSDSLEYRIGFRKSRLMPPRRSHPSSLILDEEVCRMNVEIGAKKCRQQTLEPTCNFSGPRGIFNITVLGWHPKIIWTRLYVRCDTLTLFDESPGLQTSTNSRRRNVIRHETDTGPFRFYTDPWNPFSSSKRVIFDTRPSFGQFTRNDG